MTQYSKQLPPLSPPLLTRPFHALLNFTGIGLSVFWTAAMCFVVSAGFAIDEKLGHDTLRVWAKVFLLLLGVRIYVRGQENIPTDRSMVISANHNSVVDILVLAALPVSFKWLSKKEVGRIPLMGWCMRNQGAFFVSRDKSGKDLKVMQEIEAKVHGGKSVAIFPEGTRSKTGEMLPFKKGAFKVAQNAGVPMLPIAILGTDRMAPPGSVFPNRWGHRVDVFIGRPFEVPTSQDLTSAMAGFRQKLEALIQEGRAT